MLGARYILGLPKQHWRRLGNPKVWGLPKRFTIRSIRLLVKRGFSICLCVKMQQWHFLQMAWVPCWFPFQSSPPRKFELNGTTSFDTRTRARAAIAVDSLSPQASSQMHLAHQPSIGGLHCKGGTLPVPLPAWCPSSLIRDFCHCAMEPSIDCSKLRLLLTVLRSLLSKKKR